MGMPQAGVVPAKESSTRLAWFSRQFFALRISDLEKLLNVEQAQFFASTTHPAVLDKAAIDRSKFYLGLVKTCASTAPLPLLLAVQQCCQHPPRSFSVITSKSADDKYAAS